MKIYREKIKIADFNKEYLPQVQEILKENFEYPWSEEQILSSNAFSIKKVFLYENNPVAFFAGELIFSEGSISMIAVKKELQGKGIGKYVISWFIDLCKQKGINNIWLEVSQNNKKAIRFYESFGFTTQDIRKNYYKDGSDALIMKLSL
ncbi:ribosomal protein S18-alanine N-acetyltransferase [Persephonella sp. KM09-Lau-8]|uniref:ribosomal protein S18-alanine N-acetyltransferase n=1 Tax=Persephonella sp. KM09-Lau-8 TaxID=1158345 RepID=UPI00068B7D6F|nr:ribosomal protein S18-alanine N-acetyltransferase [Persephonella sp. KM09-Lau-8]